MNRALKIYIAGIRGMVGSAIRRRLAAAGCENIIGHKSYELDLTDQKAVSDFFRQERPEYVFLAAAKVGGIYANTTYRAEFIYVNLMIECNVVHAAYQNGVKKLLFLGSSCIYPKMAPQPMKEKHLLTGPLEPTNEPYAIAKIAGIKLCESYNRQYHTDFISCMPTNLYGLGDNYDPVNSHVIPGLIRRFHDAKLAGQPEVAVWGSGRPRREFLFVDDLADAALFLMQNYTGNETVNVGSGIEVTIRKLAGLVKKTVGYEGKIVYDRTRPDGTPRKLLDTSKINALGWTAKTGLAEGLKAAYEDFLKKKKV